MMNVYHLHRKTNTLCGVRCAPDQRENRAKQEEGVQTPYAVAKLRAIDWNSSSPSCDPSSDSLDRSG